MLTENDLRDALHNTAAPQRSLSTGSIVRRGNRRRVAARSAAGASAAGVAAVVGVTGLALSGGSSPTSGAGQVGNQPAPQSSAPAASTPSGPPTSASLAQTVTAIPFGNGTVAYALRPEPAYGGADGVVLDLAAPDGTLTTKVDGGIPADASEAHWWYGEDPEHPSWWIVYGAVPAGATQVELVIEGKPIAVGLSTVPGDTALVFTMMGRSPAYSLDGPVSKLTYVDAAGNTVTAPPAGSQSVH